MKETDFDFLKLAKQEILYIQDALENSPIEDDLEIDLLDDILYIKLEDSSIYVINKHELMKELWLSSPISGGHHFVYNPVTSRWIDAKNSELRELLSRELRVSI
jgi:iron donor protein CyaY